MIPATVQLNTTDIVQTFNGLTYAFDIDSQRIGGFVDGIDAGIQAAYKILSTERYAYPIYSDGYGVELMDLYGQDMPLVIALLPARIQDALLYDNRIQSVDNFNFFTQENDTVLVTFDITIDNTTVGMELTTT